MKVYLKNASEIEKLEGRLATAIDEYIGDKQSTLRPEYLQALKKVFDQMRNVVARKLKENTSVEGEPCEEDADAFNILTEQEGLVLARISDDELETLNKEVNELANRVAHHRMEVPSMLQKQLEYNLECLRPPKYTEEGLEENEVLQLPSPTPSDLQNKLQSCSSSLPKMRARVEEAMERMRRIVHAIEEERGRVRPCEIERAILSPIATGNESYESPKVREAVSTGKINTRRRIARATLMSPYMR